MSDVKYYYRFITNYKYLNNNFCKRLRWKYKRKKYTLIQNNKYKLFFPDIQNALSDIILTESTVK